MMVEPHMSPISTVIFIPGIMGTKLFNGTEEIWPGSIDAFIFGYKHVAELTDPRLPLIVGDVIRSVSVQTQYAAILADLEACGFKEGQSLFVYPYDWRKDNRESAKGLADLVDRVAPLAEREIAVVAHSMGGLIARHYLESGLFDARPGTGKVKHLFTLATPHRGAPLALTAALGMEARVFLSGNEVYALASKDEFPSLYQLLPPPGEPFMWSRNPNEVFRPVDLYDIENAKRLTSNNGERLNLKNLESARQLHASLNLPKGTARARYFFFVGTHERTTNHVGIQTYGGGSHCFPEQHEKAGDGTVPRWSGSLTGIQSLPVPREHSVIYKGADLRRVLGVLLGRPGILAAEIRVEVSVREKVAAPGSDVLVTLNFPAAVTRADGIIRLERIAGAEGALPVAAKAASANISYSGQPLVSLATTLKAPSTVGLYRVVFVADSTVSDPDEFFVQSTASSSRSLHTHA
jgi:pimeloyl-ACP methyl ester carboxylesterase